MRDSPSIYLLSIYDSLEKTMKAAVLREIGKPLSIEEVQIDKPKGHEVLVRTAACGVCRSDLHYSAPSLGRRLDDVALA